MLYKKDNMLVNLFENLDKVDLGGLKYVSEAPEQEGAGGFEVTEEIVDQVIEKLPSLAEYDRNEVIRGIEVEQEHGPKGGMDTDITGDDPVLTAKIALAHLRELPDYYTRLDAMEEEGKAALSGKPKTPESEPAQEDVEAVIARGGVITGADESKVNEQEPTKLTVVADDISDEADAKKIQTQKPGSIVQQDPETKKYKVVLKEYAGRDIADEKNKSTAGVDVCPKCQSVLDVDDSDDRQEVRWVVYSCPNCGWTDRKMEVK